ncbi:MAG: 6-bladed beta-propeller [Parabacteroides sp.]
MKYNIILLSALLFILFIGCVNNKEKPVLLNHFSIKETHPELTSLFTDKYQITPLETKAECLVGQIDKIRKFEGQYYISSTNGHSLLHFDDRGKFVVSLNKQGQGPEEYSRIEDFDIYRIDKETEVWISDNKNIKVYDATDFSFKYKISFPFVIHKFKRMDNSHILLVTGQSKNILTLTDKKGKVLSESLKKEIPYIMFRPVQFVKYASEYLYQIGIANAYIAFDPQTETFHQGRFINNKAYLSKEQLLNLFTDKGMNFITEANKEVYISNIISLGDIFWMQTCKNGKNYLTKIQDKQCVSTEFDYGSVISTVFVGESDNSILLYINREQLADYGKNVLDKFGNKIVSKMDDNPYILEFVKQ